MIPSEGYSEGEIELKKLCVKTVFCRIFKAVGPRRIAQSVLAACLFIGAAVLAAQPARAEGTADILESSRDNYLALYKGTKVGGNEVNETNVDNGLFDGHMSLWKLMVKDSPDNTGAKREADSFGGVTNQLRVKFYAYEGEIAFIGSSSYKNGAMITLPDGTTEKLNLMDRAGHITSKNGYVNGPNGVYKAITDDDGKSLGTNASEKTTNGYNAFTYEINQSGVYIVDFYADGTSGKDTKRSFDIDDADLAKNDNEYNNLYAFDITVCKKAGTTEEPQYNAVSGRVWMDAFSGQMNSGDSYGMYGYLYATTRDGYIWRLALNGIQPYTVALYANQRGGIGKGTNASAYHSVHEPQTNSNNFGLYSNLVDKNGNDDGIMIYGPDNETTDIDAPDHMFFNYPDKDLPKSIVADVSKDPFSVTDIQFDGRDPTIKEIVGGDGSLDEKIDNSGTVGVGGYFTVDTSGATSYRVIIDMSNMYARYYHGENGNEVGYEEHEATGEDHDEEICLSAKWEDSDNGKHINFIYYNTTDNTWYNIYSTVTKDVNGKTEYDMHPINTSAQTVEKVIGYEKLDKQEMLDALGLTNANPNGADIIGSKTDFQFKCLGKIMLGNAAVEGQTDRIYWNGRDQWGRILPVGQYFGDTGRGKVYAEAKAGEVHFPISDAESIPNGLAVWLMNADEIVDSVKTGSAYNVNSVIGETAVRSNLYYNNEDKSLLRDYATTFNGQANVNIAWVWNLPSNMANYEAGQGTNGHGGNSWLNKKWVDSNAVFENKSIDGIASYSDSASPTKVAGKFKNEKDSAGNSAEKQGDNTGVGSDHGIFDVWTHVISPNTKELGTLTLYHFANRKIITGFVFLDTPEPGTVTGKYDRMTNDHELEGAIIVAEYGDKSKKNDPSNDKLISGQRWVHYEAKTDTDGYYSIPVDLTAFGTDDLNTDGTYPVQIYVYYNENLSGAITHKVTTVDSKIKSDHSTTQSYSEFIGQQIRSESVPSVSKQTVNVPKYIEDARGTTNVYLKEVYAGQVGYIAEAVDQALTITKKWEPSYLKSSTLEASFTIVGMKEGVRTTIEEFFKNEGKENSEGQKIVTVTEYDEASKTVKEVQYDQAAYTAKYGCTESGVRDETPSGKNDYVAIQHDPNFPSDTQIAEIKNAVDKYNAANPGKHVTVQDVLINGTGGIVGIDINFPGYKKTTGGKSECDVVYVVENATVEEARGGIYTNKILPKYTYKLSEDKNKVETEGNIVYRVYENPLGSGSASADAAKTKYGIARTGNEWTYTNILNLINYTLTLFHDVNNDGKLSFTDYESADESSGNGMYGPEDTLTEDTAIPNATVRIVKMQPGGNDEITEGFYHTLSDETLNERMADSSLVGDYNTEYPGVNPKDTEGNFTEEYKKWANLKIDQRPTEDGIQELIKPEDRFTTDEHGQVTFDGLSTGTYQVHVIYPTSDNYNIVTVDGTANSYIEVVQNDLDNHEYIQAVTIGADSNYYSYVGLGFKATMPLSEILQVYKNLTVAGRPGGVTADVALNDPFTAHVEVKYTGTDPAVVPDPSIEDKNALPTAENKNPDMTVNVTTPAEDTMFPENKNITFNAAGKYTITVTETVKAEDERGYIVYDKVAKTFDVEVANEEVDGVRKITVKSDDSTDLRESGKQKKITINNTLNTGYVTVKKEVVGSSANPNDEFTFTLGVADASGMKSFHILKGGASASEEISHNGTFKLKNVESAIIYDIPVGATVTVMETNNSAYTSKITSGAVSDPNPASFKVESAGANKTITFTNTHNEADLAITQKVTKDNPTVSDEQFTYEIAITGMTYECELAYEINGVEQSPKLKFTKDDKATLTLKDGETATIKGLPLGCTYTVTQTSAPTLYKVTEIEGDSGAKPDIASGTITDTLQAADTSGKVETVTFTDDFQTGDLAIKKTVYGSTAAADFTFNLTLTAPADITLADSYTTSESGVTLTHGTDNEYSLTVNVPAGTVPDVAVSKTITIQDLPVGTTVNIAEVQTTGYVLTKTDNISDIEIADDTATAKFVNNAAPKVTVNVIKNFDTALLTDNTKTFDFNFEVSDPVITGTGSAGTTAASAKDVSLAGTMGFSGLTKTANTGSVELTGTYGDLDYIELFNNAAGSVTYTYTIKETDGKIGGVVYDSEEHKVGVTITMDANGKLTATTTPASVTLKNTYTPTVTKFTINVSKRIDYTSLPQKANTFSFKIEGDAPMPATTTTSVTVAAKADHSTDSGAFGAITFNHAGTYTYTLTETGIGDMPGFSCDKNSHTVTVTVEDKNGVLSVSKYSVDGVDSATPAAGETLSKGTVEFVNKYDPADAKLTLYLSKELTGSALPEDHTYTFEFTLGKPSVTGASGGKDVEITATSESDKTLSGSFGELTFTKVGTYTYTISESITDSDPADGVTKYGFKSTPDKATNLVIKIKDTGGKLEIESVTFGEDSLDFTGNTATVNYTNEYSYTSVDFTFGVSKTVTGNDLVEGHDYEFDFKLDTTATAGVTMPTKTELTLTKGKSGDKLSGNFDDITFTEPGEYTFTVSETSTKDGGTEVETFRKSPDKYTVTITVKDLGGKLAIDKYSYGEVTVNSSAAATLSFINTYDPEDATLDINVVKKISATSDALTSDYNFGFKLTAGGTDNYPVITRDTATATVPAGAKESAAVSFSRLTFTAAGEYRFTVTETSHEGMFTGAAPQTITVTVKDMGGQLAVTEISGGTKTGTDKNAAVTLTFENGYTPKPATLKVNVDNVVVLADPHAPLAEGHKYEFEFTLSEASDDSKSATLPAKLKQITDPIKQDFTGIGGDYKENAADRTQHLSFDSITFDHAGTYNFTVTEDDILTITGSTSAEAPKGAFDTQPGSITITVVVEDDNGQLTVTSITGGEKSEKPNTSTAETTLSFTNTYHADPSHFIFAIQKTLVGTLPEGHYEFKFDVALADSTHDHEVKFYNDKKSDTILGSAFKTAGTDTVTKYIGVDFSEPGEYKFTVTETITDDGVDASSAFKSDDVRSHTVTVNVVDDIGKMRVESYKIDDGDLITNLKGQGTDKDYFVGTVGFTNNYDPKPATLTLNIEKQMSVDSNALPNTYSFGFEIVPEKTDGVTVGTPKPTVTLNEGETTNTATSELTFTKAGTYAFTVSENNVTVSGFKDPPAAQKVTVVVGDKGGELYIAHIGEVDETYKPTEPDPAITEKTVTFVNTYDPDEAKLTLNLSKTLTGSALPKDHTYTFAFDIKAPSVTGATGGEDVTFAEVKTGAGPLSGSFGELTFTKVGTYTYTISERITDSKPADGVTNSGFTATPDKATNLVIKIKDTGGKLEIESVTFDGKPLTVSDNTATVNYTNKYSYTSVDFTFGVSKTVDGNELVDGHNYEFDFKLENTSVKTDGVTMPTKTELTFTTDGTVKDFDDSFGAITFTEPGKYTFTVSETSTKDGGTEVATFHKSPDKYTVTITVKDIGGKLIINGYSDGDDDEYNSESNTDTLGFTNTYDPADAELDLSVLKKVTGNELLSDTTYSFSFNVEATGDHADKVTITNGEITLSANAEALKAGAKAEFKTITFSESGYYTLTVTEDDVPAGFAENTTKYVLSVHVEDIGGELEVKSCTLDGDEIFSSGAAEVEIVNTYNPADAEFKITVNKTVDGNTVLDEDNEYNFEFSLSRIKNGGGTAPSADAQTIAGIDNSNKDSIPPLTFDLTFTEAGTYTYNLAETVTDLYKTPCNCGFTIPALPAITVEVADNGEGKLVISGYKVGSTEKTGTEAVVDVENFYNPEDVKGFEVFIDKTVTGDVLPENYAMFDFTLTPDSANPTGATVTGETAEVTYNDLGERAEGKYALKDGPKSISKIDFTAAGTYKFTVTESISYGGFKAVYDSFTLTVTVIDDKGVLKVNGCTVSPDADATITENKAVIPFVNDYDAGSTALNVSVNKTLTGNDLPEGHDYTFTFTLYEDGEKLLEKSVNADEFTYGTAKEISLGSITYEAAGEHIYTVSETVSEEVDGKPVEDVNSNNHGFHETNSYTLNVKVVDEVSGTGTDHGLKVSCTGATDYDETTKSAKLDFVNAYAPDKVGFTLGVHKTVTGNALPDGHEYDFTFALSGDHIDEKTVAAVTESNKAEIGDITFDLPEFTKAGDYNYTVTETVAERFNGSAVATDSGFIAVSPVNVTVSVIDDGGKLRIADCKVDGASTGATEKYLIDITNRYIPESVSVDDPKTVGGADNNVVSIPKTLKTERGTPVDFPEAFSFNAEVMEIVGAAEKAPEPGTAGWGDGFSASTVLKTTGGSGGIGEVSVSGLKFAKAGVYKVTVSEDAAPYENEYGSIVKDAKTVEIVYTVTDDGGKLRISDVSYTPTEFENTFIPNAKTVEMTFDKRLINTMTGGDRLALTEGINDELYNKFTTLYDGRFSFTMTHDDYDSADIETDVADSEAVSGSDGSITAVNKMNKVRLGNVIIKREGSYTFTVSENQPTESERVERVGYGRRAVTVTFNVTVDPKTGELKVDTEYMYGEQSAADKPAFVNTYGPIPCTLTVTTEVTTDPEGLEFDRTKAFEYEIKVWGDHISPDAERNEDGKRTATFRIFYEKPLFEIAALYDDDEEEDISVPVEFVETSEGSGVYAFTLAGYGDNSFTIEDIPYGRVYYSVEQKLGAQDAALGYSFVSVGELYTYKDTAETVSKTEDMTDEKTVNTQLETGEFVGEFDGTVITYKNLYTVKADTETLPEIEKKMSGERGLIEGEEYSFTVSLDAPEGGAVLGEGERTVTATAAADSAGEVTAKANIGGITFTKPGVYTVTVKEVIPAGGELDGVKYDETVYTVVYTVTDTDPATGAKDGKLRADMAIYADGDEAEEIVFTNTYSAADTGEVTFDISKLVIPDDPNALPHDEEYRFGVTDENGLGKDTEASVTIYSDDYDSAEGNIAGKTTVSLGTFGDKGTYTFKVSEISSDTLGMIYDKTVHTVTVEVTDNLKGGLEYEVYVDGVSGGEVQFINRYLTGGITVTNTLTGTGIDVTLPFEYKVTVTGSDGLPASYNYTVGPKGGASLFTVGGAASPREISGKITSGGTIELTHGEKFTVTGIPEGALVTVEQLPADGYDTSVNGEERYTFSSTVSSAAELKADYLNRHYDEYGRFTDFVTKTQNYPGEGESVRTGDTLSYTINWRNPKLKDAKVVITDTLSEGVELIEATDGYEYDPDTRTVTWTIEARGLEAGEVELTVKVNETAAELGSVSNTSHAEVYVDSEPGEPSGEPSAEDDSNEVINPVATVELEKRESIDGTDMVESLSVRAGDMITYYLTAEISGAGVKNLTIADIIPDGLEYIGSSDGNAVYDPASGTVTWTFTDPDGEPTVTEPGRVTVSYQVRVPEVSTASGWSSCGYVYEGKDEVVSTPSDGYPWISSNYVEALPMANLTVKKTVHSDDGSAPAGIKFRFTVDITDEYGLPVSGIIYETNGVRGAVSDGRLMINLGDGESVTLCDIPAGSAYTISEEPVTNFTPDPENIYSGLLKNIDAAAEIVNNYSFVAEKFGDITVTKAVAGTDEDMLREFGFTLALADTSVNGVYGDLEFIAGEARFSLSNGEVATAVGLPADVGYTVYENAEDSEGFKTTDSGNTVGTVPADGAVTVMFFNEREAGAVGGLTVKNTVIGGSKAFSYTVQVYGEEPVSGVYGDMIFDASGLAAFTLAPGESITAVGLPAGASYTVIETDADAEGYVTEFTDDCSGVIPAIANANVEFINTRRTGSLTVKNTVIGGADEFSYVVTVIGGIEPGIYGDIYFDADGTATFTLFNGESVTMAGLPAGAAYEVVEIEADQRGYVTASSGAQGIIPESMSANASFVNTLTVPGSLTVSKTVIGGSGSESFGFTLSLADPAGEPLEGVFGEITTGPDGIAQFELSDGESITVPLPEGTAYSVYEDVISASGYISEVSGAAAGMITADGANVAFTNTLRTGSLTVTDFIGGNAADPSRTFTFTVTAPVTGRYGDMVFDGTGTAVFTLGHGRSATAEGLPAGISYTVTETDANTDGYLTECNGIEYAAPVSGVIAEGSVTEVKFRNIKQIDDSDTVGSLTVVNNIIGTVTDEEFEFTVAVEDPSGLVMAALLEENYPVAAINNGGISSIATAPNGDALITFSLKHGESKRINGLPAGARYTVTETGSLYYLVSSVNDIGTVPSGANQTAVFTNRWNAGDLSVSVTVEDDSGMIRTDDRAEFTYKVTLEGVGSGFKYPSHITEKYAGAEASGDQLMVFDETGVAFITLKGGETAIAPDLPAGLSYKTELVSQSDDLHYNKSESGTEGAVTAGETVEAEYVYYIRTGSLTLTKKLLDNNDQVTGSRFGFEFTLRLYGADGLPLTGAYVYDGAYSGTVADNGVIKLRGGESVTVYGLPEGAEYSITEKPVHSYPMISEVNANGVITAGENIEAVITNKLFVFPEKPKPEGSGGGTEPEEPDDEPEDPGEVEIERPTEGRTAEEDLDGGEAAESVYAKPAARKKE